MNGAAWRAAVLAFAFALPASAQQATPLSQLIQEAKANNSSIAAADHGARAARMVAPQKATMPDPTFTVQQFSVGSPKPFAGYTNSDFAYIAVDASQELPYPGKLRLRAEVAERDADTKAAEADTVAADVADAVKLRHTLPACLSSANPLRAH